MISKFFINRPIFASVLSILLIVGGWVAMTSLPIEQYPSITPPTVVVSAEYPGANAEDIAQMVGTPIEEAINGVEGMMYMSSSSSSSGTYSLTVTFDIGTDVDIATVLVQNRLNSALSLLPEEVNQLGVTTKKQSTDIVMFVSITSKSPEYDALYLSNFASLKLVNELGRIPGVANVQVFGMGDYSMRVWLDPNRMAIRNVTPQEVAAAIESQNVQVSAGAVGAQPMSNAAAYQYTLQTKGLLQSADEFEKIIIRAEADGSYLRLADIATVSLGREIYDNSASLSGEPVAALAIYQLPTGNALDVANGVKTKLETLKSFFPQGVDYEVTLDTTDYIKASLKDIYTTLIIAFILVLIVVLLFLQEWRSTFIPMVTIPVSLIGTFLFMAIMGFSLNMLTLFGIVLAIGLVVDDAIIIVENSYRLIETGKYPTVKEAVIQAMDEVADSIISIVLVLLAVFVPTSFMGGVTGELYRQFALTLSAAVVISGFNALTLSPALCALLLKNQQQQEKKTFFIYRWFNKGFDKLSEGFMWIIARFLKNHYIALIIFAILTFGAFYGLSHHPKSFIPTEDQGYFFVAMQLTDGASLEQTEQAVNEVGEILKHTDGIKDYIAIGGFSLLSNSSSPNTATIFVMLENWDKRKAKSLQAQSIVNKFNEIAYAEIRQAHCFAINPPPIPGLGESSGFQVMVEDINNLGPQALQQCVDQIIGEAYQDKSLKEVNSEYSASVPQYYLEIDRDKVAYMGVEMSSLFQTLSSYLGTQYINNFVKYGRIYQVRMAGEQGSRRLIDDIKQIHVTNAQGESIPIGVFINLKEVFGPEQVTRYNTYSAAMISGEGAVGVSSQDAIDQMANIIKSVAQQNYSYEWTAMAYQQEDASGSTSSVFILAILIAYLIMAAKYESWTLPVAVIMGLPIAILGVVAGAIVMSLSISVYTQIGIILLIGLAAKNAILIVEFARDYHEQGMSVNDAALEAARIRLRPILMTSFAFILGTFPLVIATGAGAASRISLGVAVFAGMTMTSFVGTLFIPNFYKLMQEIENKFSRSKKK